MIRLIFILLTAASLTACTSLPQPEPESSGTFSTLQIQDLKTLTQGRVENGFTTSQVSLNLGMPHSSLVRPTADQTTVTYWTYTWGWHKVEDTLSLAFTGKEAKDSLTFSWRIKEEDAETKTIQTDLFVEFHDGKVVNVEVFTSEWVPGEPLETEPVATVEEGTTQPFFGKATLMEKQPLDLESL